MQRRGNYSDYCGTSACIPVFVTTNSRLIGVSLAYRKCHNQISSINGWKQNRLPVITDSRLTCRLWTPATQGAQMSRLYLAANAVAAQRPTNRYLNRVRELAQQFEKTTPEYASIPLPSYFDDVVTDAILEHTKGDESKLNIGNLASSIQELTEWKARDQEILTHQARNERDQYHGKYSAQTKSIIESAIEANKNKIGISRLLLTLISWWAVIAPILFTGISAVISLLANSWTIFWGAFALVVVFIISEFIVKRFINRKLLMSALPYIEKQIKKTIENNLRNSELPYKDQIVPMVIEQNEQLKKCRDRLSKATDS